MTALSINLNIDRLSNVVKGNLVGFYGKNLTPDLIDVLTKQIAEAVNHYVNLNDEDYELQQTNKIY